MRGEEFKKALSLLKEAESALILTHERPDGDAIGSLLALTLALDQWEVPATPVIQNGSPINFQFLPGAERISPNPEGNYDVTVVLDCSDLERTGFAPESLSKPDLNIDHHPTNTLFAGLNIVDVQAAATTEILARMFIGSDLEITIEIASNLLTGLITDTVGFSTSSVTPAVFQLAADLTAIGAPVSDLYDRALNRKSLVGFKYWGYGLIDLEEEDGLVWTSLTLDERKQAGYPRSDDADLVNILQRTEGARVALIFVEQPDEKVKVSWRSKADVNVAAVASSFGGGGHEQAAGAMVTGNLQEVQSEVLEATRKLLEKRPETP